MLHKLLIFSSFLFISTSISAQNECSTYYPFKEGVKYEMTTYDKNDNITGLVKYEIKNVTDQSAVLVNEVFDKKGTSILGSELNLTCDGDGISIDFNSLISGQVLEQYEAMKMDISMSGTNIVIPNNLNVGQTLPDAELLITMSMASVNMQMTVNMINRKVTGNETITTPAGTFDCIILSSETEVKMGMTQKVNSKQWLAEGVGPVKSEEYDEKGKLNSKSLLTKLEN